MVGIMSGYVMMVWGWLVMERFKNPPPIIFRNMRLFPPTVEGPE